MDLDIFNADGKQESVCLQCPLGTAGDGRECRGMKYYCGKLKQTTLNVSNGRVESILHSKSDFTVGVEPTIPGKLVRCS